VSVVTDTTARSAEKYRVTRSRRNVAWTGLFALAVVVVLALFPYLVGAGVWTIMVQAFIILTLASMWNLLAGYAGLVSVGQQAFVGLGAYFVLALNINRISMFTALPIAVIGCGVAAVPLWWLVSRLRTGYFAIATWVLATTVMLIIERIPSLGSGTGLSLPNTPNIGTNLLEAYTYWIGLAVTVLALLTVYLLLRSRLGLVLTAIRDDEVAARSSGARVGVARMLVFVIAGAGCGAAGGLLAISQLIVQPSAVFGVQWTAEMAFAVIIGGLGTIEGPILGTIVYIVLQQTLASYNAWYLIILGLVAMGVAIFARRGLWGLIDDYAHVRLFPVGYWLWSPDSESRRGLGRRVASPADRGLSGREVHQRRRAVRLHRPVAGPGRRAPRFDDLRLTCGRMDPCCSLRSPRCRGSWPVRAPGWPRSVRWPSRCARPGRSRCRSPWRTCPVSCRSGRWGSGGRPCGGLRGVVPPGKQSGTGSLRRPRPRSR
jgi:ABC-type branched-subunit amino acid transport system permease subunit